MAIKEKRYPKQGKLGHGRGSEPGVLFFCDAETPFRDLYDTSIGRSFLRYLCLSVNHANVN
jgi:hypothetical protein